MGRSWVRGVNVFWKGNENTLNLTMVVIYTPLCNLRAIELWTLSGLVIQYVNCSSIKLFKIVHGVSFASKVHVCVTRRVILEMV